MLSLWFIAGLFASLAHAANPVAPSQDPFYTPTGDWKSTAPGAILAHREVPNPLKNVSYSAAYQLLYRTTDSLGDAVPAVTTVIIPQGNANYSKLLSYQIVYDTADFDCSPSYILQEGGVNAFDNGFTYGLMAGAIINTPDYEGPKAAFTAGIISGQATLDSIRAALSSTSITKIQKNATVAMWGYSGGVRNFCYSLMVDLALISTMTGPSNRMGLRTTALLRPRTQHRRVRHGRPNPERDLGSHER